MEFKKYIDENNVKDVPLNGVITVDIENDKGEIVETRTGVSNIPLAFEKDEALANKNGYYRYEEDPFPGYNELEEYVTYKYVLEDNVIRKTWSVHRSEEIYENE